MNGKPKIIESKTVYEGLVFDVVKSKIREVNSKYERDVITHNGSAVIVPVIDNSVVLVKQYRHAAGQYLLELPAGSVEDGETPLECAYREVEEEIGMKAKSLEKLTEFYVSPGFLSEKMHLYLATDLTKSEQNLDEDENISLVKVSMKKALEMVHTNEIEDAKTMLGMIFARERFGTTI